MRIVYFAESIEKDKDGVTRVLYKLNELNNRKNIDTLYVTSVPEDKEHFNYYRTKSLPIPGYDGYRMSISRATFLARIVREYGADLIHLHAPFNLGRTGIFIARKLGIPCVSTYHTHFTTYLKYHNAQILEPLINAHIKAIYNACDLNLIPSENVRLDLEKIGVRNMKVLPHGVDEKTFNRSYYSDDFRNEYSGKVIFLYVGRLVWEKNLKLMAQVFNALYSERNDFELLLVGTGPAEERLKELLPRAKFLGFKSGIELSTIYASSDVFVFPSDTETFGNVTIEAISSGLPCLVADGGGSGDIIRQNVDGFKFKADSYGDFLNYAKILIENPELRNEFRSNALIRSENFRWEAVHDKMIEYYQEQIDAYSHKSDVLRYPYIFPNWKKARLLKSY